MGNYSLANPDDAKKDDPRANSFFALGGQLVKQNIDWESKYKHNMKKSLIKVTNTIFVIIPRAVAISKEQQQKNDKFLISAIGEECVPMVFSSIPFPFNLRSKTCQVCQYKMKKVKSKEYYFVQGTEFVCVLKAHCQRVVGWKWW
jgi:hypothetical protein